MDPVTISILVTVLTPFLTGFAKWLFPDATKDTVKAIPVITGAALNCIGVLTGADASLDLSSIAMAGGAGAAYGSLGSKGYDVKQRIVKGKKSAAIPTMVMVLLLSGCAGMSVKAFEDKAQSLGLGACAVIKVLNPGPQMTAKLVFSLMVPHLDGIKINPDGTVQGSLDLNKIIDTVKAANPDLVSNIKHGESFELGLRATLFSVHGEIENKKAVAALNFLKRFVGTVSGCVVPVVVVRGGAICHPPLPRGILCPKNSFKSILPI